MGARGSLHVTKPCGPSWKSRWAPMFISVLLASLIMESKSDQLGKVQAVDLPWEEVKGNLGKMNECPKWKKSSDYPRAVELGDSMVKGTVPTGAAWFVGACSAWLDVRESVPRLRPSVGSGCLGCGQWGRQKDALPQWYPHPNCWNLWMWPYLTVQKEACRCDYADNLEMGRLSWIRSRVITRLLRAVRVRADYVTTKQRLADVARSQGMWETSRSWKSQRTDSSLKLPEGMYSCQQPDFGLIGHFSNFWPPKL